ncbi:hypothetical protein ACFX2G_043654 [Malus domestica]
MKECLYRICFCLFVFRNPGRRMELPNFQGGGYPLHALFVTEMIRSLNVSNFSAGNLLLHFPCRPERASQASVAFGCLGEENHQHPRQIEDLVEEKTSSSATTTHYRKRGWQCKEKEGNQKDRLWNFLFHKKNI